MRILLVLASFLAFAAPAAGDDWARFAEEGRTILIRHALAPGTGDPAGFSVADCSTQRNLSQEGREQARRLGEAFRKRGVPIGPVFTSRWCRSAETARLAFPQSGVTEFPAIDSFFSDRAGEPAQTAAARRKIDAFRGPGNQVFVTHQVNITALTGVVARQGEALLVEPDGQSLRVVARVIVE